MGLFSKSPYEQLAARQHQQQPAYYKTLIDTVVAARNPALTELLPAQLIVLSFFYRHLTQIKPSESVIGVLLEAALDYVGNTIVDGRAPEIVADRLQTFIGLFITNCRNAKSDEEAVGWLAQVSSKTPEKFEEEVLRMPT